MIGLGLRNKNKRKSLSPVLVVAVVFLVLGSGNVRAQETVFRYKSLRYDEDFSYLKDPAKGSDPFDVIKYIPLRTDTDDWYLSIGGEIKERFEGWRNPNWGEAGKEDNYLLQRFAYFPQ